MDFYITHYLIILESALLIIGMILPLFSIFFYNKSQSLLKISGIFIIAGFTLLANESYIYLVSFFIIGTIVTGKHYLLELMEKWKTKREIFRTEFEIPTIEPKASQPK